MKNTKQTKNVNQVNLLIAHNAMKSYIVEKACLNELKQGDTISYKKLIDLSCQSILDNDKSLILDTLIEKNENLLVIKNPKEYYTKLYFISRMDIIFGQFCYFNKYPTNIFNRYKKSIKPYIENLYALFCEILETNPVNISLPCDFKKSFPPYTATIDFLIKVITKNIRANDDVTVYIKNSYYFLDRLITFKNDKYVLINDNIYSIDFKLDILNLITFNNDNNTYVFEKKSLQWQLNQSKGR